MCDTTIICTGHQDGGGGGGLDAVVGGAVIATGRGIYGLAGLGAEILIRAGRWFSGKPMVSAKLWGRPYRFTRAVRAVGRIILTGIALASWFRPVITGLVLATVGALSCWLILWRRRRTAAIPVKAVLGAPVRAALEGTVVGARPALTARPAIDAEVISDARPAITMGAAVRRIGSLLAGRR